MKICIIGTGYVGLVSGAAFAEAGNTVICVDKDQVKISALKDGLIPIYEPGLETLVTNNFKHKRLVFTTDLALGINQADVTFIAVGTPQGADGSVDLRAVYTVCEEICAVATKDVVIATKSTVPVGTGDKIEALFKEKLKFPFVAFANPEFLKEGDAVNDFMKPDRIIIGTNDERIIPIVQELYAPFTHQRNRLIFMSRRSAEITKYAANAMLALRISFMNELAGFCDAVGGNINDVRTGIGSDDRIGPAFLYAGLGYGGSCFPKDVKALLKASETAGTPLKTVLACDEANQNQVKVFFGKIAAYYGGIDKLKGMTLALWGLSFKAKTDDIRESPALKLADLLLASGVKLRVTDPQAMQTVRKIYGEKLFYFEDGIECLKEANGLILATEWNEFRSPDFAKAKTLLKRAVVFDGRNLFDAKALNRLGFDHIGVGVKE